MLLGAPEASACWRRRRPFPELKAKGVAGDLGLAHGRAFGTQIEYNRDFYLDWLSQSGSISQDRLFELARGFLPVIEEHFPEIAEEMDGIARGAGLDLQEIALINARTDISAIVKAELKRATLPGCTALALFGRAKGKPALALGQNWDWNPRMAEAPVLLRLAPADAPELVTLVEAGMVGKIGFNQERLGVCLNFMKHLADGRPGRFGVPIHCLLRVALSCETLKQAVERIEGSPRCASANFLLARHGLGEPEALDLEISPDSVGRLRPEGASLVHTNHFLSAGLAEGCTSGRGPSTMKRLAMAEKLATELEESETDPVKRMQRILASRENLPYPISRQRNPDPSSSTLAGVVMDLTRNRLILTKGAPHVSDWIRRPGV
jgi:isopenicillin-N N-acyltransferase-like protein